MLSEEEIERYKRQIRIDKIGAEGQDKIKNSSVLSRGTGKPYLTLSYRDWGRKDRYCG